ncbi:SPFH domain-containing protein [Devosia sediminis]|uniref:SPFH domain-containing protein n=1 Tax=Devosia sediminis TaxID=2798801 RepID=A0A934IRY4_9HYPH|nr:SPFH domain-containing protein [Devosia sediminis]MBJ3784086.1 SPFH domain-containing protein [Devosia sediminis]
MEQVQIPRTGEKLIARSSGVPMLIVVAGLILAAVAIFFVGVSGEAKVLLVLSSIGILVVAVLIACGFYNLQPNQAAAITLFGAYIGTDRNPGLGWVLPWYGRTKISLRVRNVTSETLKVNDKRGNPIEIAVNVVWRVQDSAQALFDVDNYTAFAGIQIETSLREVARQYSYDHSEDEEPTLRDDAELIGERLRADLSARVAVAGIQVDEVHLMHLAYAPEIAGSMLKRQQAEAVIAARQKIVAGAVGMVEMALNQLSARDVVDLDEERKAAMVSNLLVVLCADREAQPVVNAGTLYT